MNSSSAVARRRMDGGLYCSPPHGWSFPSSFVAIVTICDIGQDDRFCYGTREARLNGICFVLIPPGHLCDHFTDKS